MGSKKVPKLLSKYSEKTQWFFVALLLLGSVIWQDLKKPGRKRKQKFLECCWKMPFLWDKMQSPIFLMHNQIMSRLVKKEPPWQSICKTWKEEYTKWVTIHVVEKHDGIKNDIEKET